LLQPPPYGGDDCPLAAGIALIVCSQDRSLTQEFIAQMLGTRRPGVTVAAAPKPSGMIFLAIPVANATIVERESPESPASVI